MRSNTAKMIVWVRPENDPKALVLSEWAEKFSHGSAKYGALDLRGTKASRKAVSDALANKNALFFFGHGVADALLGARGALLDRQNLNLTHGRIVIAIACHAAHVLGTAAVRNGAVAFLGFASRLVWIRGFAADDFGRAATASVEATMRGETLRQAANAMRERFAELERRFLESTHPNAGLVWTSACWNRVHIMLKGDGSATLESVEQSSVHGPGLLP